MSGVINIPSGGNTTFSIKVNGTTIPDETRVMSILVESAINSIPKAKIVILDGEANKGTFRASSSDTFLPGSKLTIEAGYDSKNKIIFSGIITGQSIRIDPVLGSALIVECKDEAVKMIVGRKSLTFSKKTDSDIISSIISNYSGVSASVSSTTTEWPEQVQYYATDWDFILTRAEANGLIVTASNGKLTVKKPNEDTDSVLTIEYGNNLIEFNADLNAITQLKSAKAITWDYKTQEVISGESTGEYSGPGDLTSDRLSEVLDVKNYQLQTSANLTEADLTNWTKSSLIKSEYSKIQGEVKFQGTGLVSPSNYITLKGIGSRFSGAHLVSGITHNISEGNWVTEASIGLSPIWFSEEPDVMSQPTSGLLPGIRGLFNGTVKKMFEDPENQFRILVDVPLYDANGEGVWARLSNFYSTSGAGAFFLPEVGDEVILGCLNEDPRFPIILGSLYSSDKMKPFEGLEPNEKNTMKAIVSKSGISISFDDENEIFTITTPNKNTAIFSDKEKQITIQDENQNSIVMSEDGIKITSEKDITVQATEKLTLQGDQGVVIESSAGDVDISGLNVKVTAEAQYSVNGGEIAEINSSAELSLNSGMIMIN